MAMPPSMDIRQAFLTALNESEERYLLVGDMAWNKHREGIRESKTAEAWIDPSASVESVLAVYAQTYAIVRQAHPETNRDELMAGLKDEVKIHKEQYPLNFDIAYEQKVPWVRYGEATNVLNVAHIYIKEMQSPDERRQEQARDLLGDINSKKLGLSQKPERGPDDDPGRKPTPPHRRPDRDRGPDRD